jgi:hypothetical protein
MAKSSCEQRSRRFEPRNVLKIEITKNAEPKNAAFQSSGEIPNREGRHQPNGFEKGPGKKLPGVKPLNIVKVI